MGEPAKKLPDPEAWGDAEIEHNTALLEAIDSGRTAYKGDPETLNRVRMGLDWRAAQQEGDEDALATPFETWVAASTAPKPAAGKVTELPAVPIEGDPEADIWEQIASGAADLGRGAGQGASFGMGDEGAATMQAMMPSPMDGQRRSGRSFDAPLADDFSAVRGEALQSERSANETAQERSPWLYTGGAIAGGLPAAIATAPVGGGAGLAVRAGQNAMHGGALGLAAGYGASEAETDLGLLEDAGDAGMVGGALGGAGTVAAAGAGAMGRGAGEMLEAGAEKAQRAGWRNRAAATGMYGGEMAKLVKQRGRDLPERIGETIERYGAHKRPEAGPLTRWIPQSAGVYADTTGAAMKQAGQRMGGAIDDATAAGATVDPKTLASGMRDAQTEHLAAGQPNNKAIAKHIDSIANDLAARHAARGGRPMTPREAWDYRHNMKPTAGLENSRNVMPSVGMQGQAYREGRDVIHDSVLDSLGDAAPAYRQAETDYGMLTMANNASRQREAQELGNQLASINSPGMAATGAVVSGVPGAAMGIGAIETAKRVGRDATADVLGGTASAMRGASRIPSAIGGLADDAGTAGARVGAPQADSLWEDFLGEASPAMAQAPTTQQQAGEHPKAARTRLALRARPAILGEYAGELQQALDAGPKEFGATMLRLQKDPEFMRSVMPALQGAQR